MFISSHRNTPDDQYRSFLFGKFVGSLTKNRSEGDSRACSERTPLMVMMGNNRKLWKDRRRLISDRVVCGVPVLYRIKPAPWQKFHGGSIMVWSLVLPGSNQVYWSKK